MDRELIAQRAYAIWQREGCPEGRAWQHWFQAEEELRARGGAVRAFDPYSFPVPAEGKADAETDSLRR